MIQRVQINTYLPVCRFVLLALALSIDVYIIIYAMADSGLFTISQGRFCATPQKYQKTYARLVLYYTIRYWISLSVVGSALDAERLSRILIVNKASDCRTVGW